MAGEGGWRQRVDPNALLIGAALAIATIVIGTGVAIYVTTDGATDDSRAGGLATSESTVTSAPRSSTTTTTPGSATTLPATGGPDSPGPDSTSTPTAAPPPPTPRATADPEDPPYEPVPVPEGAGATLDGCRWAGGQLEAWGTLTSYVEDDFWSVDVYWLQNDREIASAEGDFIDFELPGTQPWRLAVPAPVEPLDLRCEIEIF